MQYRILRKTRKDGWINLYPPIPSGKPPTYESKQDAEERALRIKKNIGVQTKVVPLEESENYETPERGYAK